MTLNLFDSKENNKYAKYTQYPFKNNILRNARLYEDRRHYGRGHRDHNLLPLSELFDFIDCEKIVEILCQKPVTDLIESLATFNERYAWITSRMHRRGMIDYESFTLDVTKNFGWKPGTYPHFQKLLDFYESRYMKPAGLERLFIRRTSNEGSIINLQDECSRLDRLRAKAKSMAGTRAVDAEEYKEKMIKVFDLIQENTSKGNKISDKVRFSQYFTTDDYDPAEPYSFLSLNLITIVHIDSMPMAYLKGGDNIFTLDQPALQAYFARPLYKVFNGNRSIGSYLYGYAKNRHAYLQDYSMWSPEQVVASHTRLNRSPWSSVCLSEHNDDVVRNMARHDYSSAAFGLTQWSASYNMDHTNPYNAPNAIVYLQGIPEILHDKPKELETFMTLINFHYGDCYQSRMNRIQMVDYAERPELSNVTSRIDNRARSNRMIFAHQMLDECSKCPVMDKCVLIQQQLDVEKAFNDDRYGMAEAITAISLEVEMHSEDRASVIVYSKFAYVMDHMSIGNESDVYDWMIYYLESYGFFDEPLTPEQQAQQALEREMVQWSIGGPNG